MNSSKWLTLTVSASIVAALSLGFASASVDDEEEEEQTLEKLMEGVSAANNRINRYVRTPVAFRKSQDDVVEYAKELVELGKKSREREEAIEKAKEEGVEKPKEKWQELMDKFVELSEDLVTVAEEGDQAKAKAAHREVKLSCANCHKVFRIEDDF